MSFTEFDWNGSDAETRPKKATTIILQSKMNTPDTTIKRMDYAQELKNIREERALLKVEIESRENRDKELADLEKAFVKIVSKKTNTEDQ